MAPVRPITKSNLKRLKDRSVPVCANNLPHIRRAEQFSRTLGEARFLSETLESVLKDLMNFKWQSPESGTLCVASALKMLGDIQKLYMKCFYEQRLLMERLRTKLESICSAGGIISFLAQEARREESALSNELQKNSSLQACCLNSHEGNQRGSPELRLPFAMLDGFSTDRKDHSRMMQELALLIRNELRIAPSDIHGQLKAMNILVASMREDFERNQKIYLATKRTMSAQQKNLSSAILNTRVEDKLRRERQLKRAQNIAQNFLLKNSELLSAKADLKSLEAEVRDLNRSVEDSGFSRVGERDLNVLDQIENISKFLQDARLPDHQIRQVCLEIDVIYHSVAFASTPVVSQRNEHESIQTVLTGERFAEAIKAHAANLFKHSKSKKRNDVNVTAAEDRSTPRKSGSK